MKASIPFPFVHPASRSHDASSRARRLWQRWQQHLRTRAELRDMDERGLADIGMDRETARQESRKFFWQC